MRRFTIKADNVIRPFNEPARDLTVIGIDRVPMTLKIHQTEVTERCLGACPVEEDLYEVGELPEKLAVERPGVDPNDSIFVYKDNIYFDQDFLEYFLEAAKQTGGACQAVLPADDRAWVKYTVPLSSLEAIYPESGGLPFYPIEMWYFPQGWQDPWEWYPLPVPSDSVEKGYYNIPDTMTNIQYDPLDKSKKGVRDQDLTHFQAERTCVVIESWVHLFNAAIPLGAFSYGSRFEEHIRRHNWHALRLLFYAIVEQKQIRSSSKMVEVGPNCDIDPSAVILGPTKIGRNCSIGPGVVIDNCVIGDNVNIAQGCQLMLSVVGHNVFLPFRAALFMTMVMDNTIIAQNTCLQMCIVGRNSFVGAGTTFTDFNLLPSPLKALNHAGQMEDIRQPVMGGCVGHNCRLGAGLVIYPARIIESDVILVASHDRRVIMKEINYEMSDHHRFSARVAMLHKRLYKREGILDESELLEAW